MQYALSANLVPRGEVVKLPGFAALHSSRSDPIQEDKRARSVQRKVKALPLRISGLLKARDWLRQQGQEGATANRGFKDLLGREKRHRGLSRSTLGESSVTTYFDVVYERAPSCIFEHFGGSLRRLVK